MAVQLPFHEFLDQRAPGRGRCAHGRARSRSRRDPLGQDGDALAAERIHRFDDDRAPDRGLGIREQFRNGQSQCRRNAPELALVADRGHGRRRIDAGESAMPDGHARCVGTIHCKPRDQCNQFLLPSTRTDRGGRIRIIQIPVTRRLPGEAIEGLPPTTCTSCPSASTHDRWGRGSSCQPAGLSPWHALIRQSRGIPEADLAIASVIISWCRPSAAVTSGTASPDHLHEILEAAGKRVFPRDIDLFLDEGSPPGGSAPSGACLSLKVGIEDSRVPADHVTILVPVGRVRGILARGLFPLAQTAVSDSMKFLSARRWRTEIDRNRVLDRESRRTEDETPALR